MAKKEITYNDAVIEIDEILNQIENDDLNIDDLSEKVKRVSFLLKTCKKKLVKTETEIQKVLDDIDLD
jgi:exodeoxyribonuclease VII small subunit